MENFFKSEESILLVHSDDASKAEIVTNESSLKSLGIQVKVVSLSAVVSETGLFDGISIGFVGNTSLPEDLNVWTKIASLLKPDARILLRKGERDLCRMERILRSLKFAGFVSIQEQGELVSASTASYAAGTRFDINTKALLAPKPEASSQSLWAKLTEDNQDDLIDTEQLLTEDDLKQPDPESLRVCSTTGVRKACANCVCGLAQELDAEAAEENRKVNKAMPSSSCGSCYLGDAFRCANCPYIGLPAFKPGDKVVLDDISDI